VACHDPFSFPLLELSTQTPFYGICLGCPKNPACHLCRYTSWILHRNKCALVDLMIQTLRVFCFVGSDCRPRLLMVISSMSRMCGCRGVEAVRRVYIGRRWCRRFRKSTRCLSGRFSRNTMRLLRFLRLSSLCVPRQQWQQPFPATSQLGISMREYG
jgi:hypothetical protein